jgi:hypothetical protein
MWDACEVLTHEARAKRSVGRPRRPVPADRVHELRRQGLSFREIARQTGYGYGSVRRAFFGAVAMDAPSLRSAAAAE